MKLFKNPKFVKFFEYAVTFLAGAIIALIYFWIFNLFTTTGAKSIYSKLSDGFLFSGVFIFGAGLLVLASNEGTFNFLNFTVQRIFSKFVHSMKVATMTYSEFVLSKNNKKKIKISFLLIVGAFYLLLSLLFLFLYYSI